MKVNHQGFFSDINFWKLGCNWGSHNPSFYHTLKDENIIISDYKPNEFKIGDIVLLAEGHPIIALAQIKSKPIDILSNKALVQKLKTDGVTNFGNMSYFEVVLHELPKADRFKYQLQQGIVHVDKEHIKQKATKAWLNREDKRIMRLTWNSNNWEYPSGHAWNEKHQGKTDVAHEKQYGYGHEEWLFNERFRIDGYQYGYIRGVHKLSTEADFLDQITLYTIREDKQRCLVGNIFNVEIIEDYEEEQDKIEVLIDKYKSAMLEELRKVNADFKHYKSDYLLPNVKFKWDEVDLFNEPVPVDYLDGFKYNRFQAYHLKDDLLVPIEKDFEKKAKFNFQAGKASNTGEYTKTTTSKKTKVRRRHGEITDDLHDYLLAVGHSKDDISVERTRVGGAIIDVALKQGEAYDLFEIKTSNTALKNIRQALGQILEYALLDETMNYKRLIIVGPALLTNQEKEYLARLKNVVKFHLEYWGYKSEETQIKDKFEIQ